jgi:hypothetical protein
VVGFWRGDHQLAVGSERTKGVAHYPFADALCSTKGRTGVGILPGEVRISPEGNAAPESLQLRVARQAANQG